MERQKQWYDKASPYFRYAERLMTVFFSLITITIYANNGEQDWIERKKNVTFSYNINAGDKISLENQFGDIKVNFWNKNEVKVEVTIVANATSEERASNFISTVDVVGKKSDGIVSIKTIIDREDGNYNNNTWKSGNNEKNSLRIDYQVFMPKVNALKVKNSFGNTIIPDFSSTLVVNQSYGKLIAEDVSNAQSDISLAFCKDSYIKSMVGGKLKASYSGIKMEKADNLDFNNSFGDIDIKEVGRIDAKISYSKGSIGMIKESSDLKLEFSNGFNLGGIGKNVKELGINANYSPVNLTLSDDMAYDFEVKANYGKFSYPEEKTISFTRNTETEEKKNDHYRFNSTKYYEGKIGKGSPVCKITVNGNFSSVKFK